MIHLGRRAQSWLAFATICYFVAGPQTSEAVPILLQYTYVYENSTTDYIELTFSEPVTYMYGSMPSSLTFNLDETNSARANNPITVLQHLTAPTIYPSAGIYSKYLKISYSVGSAEYNAIHYSYINNTHTIKQSFSSITITSSPALALSADGFANAENTTVMPALTIKYDSAPPPPAPTLMEFDYDVSLGQISLTFSTNVTFASFNPSSLILTNNSGMSIPVVAVSSSPVPATSYNTVQLILPVQTAVTIATSPWIGANVSLLYLNITSTAITNYIGTPLIATMPVQQVTNLKRDCYNTSTYYNSTMGNCQPCDPGCVTCAGPLPFPNNVSGCTNCRVVIMNGSSSYQCVRGTSCLDGYYQNTTNTSSITTPGSILCFPCNSSCFTCTNGTQCTSCVGLLPATPTQCCANMTGGPTCMACNASCNGGCRGPLNTDCVYCRELNYTLNGTTYCLSSCPPHTYQEEGLCLKCTSNISEVLCPPYACWLGFGYNRDTYVCELTRQFRFIVIPATCGGGGLLVITCLIICALCWHLPNASPSSRDKHAYVNPAYKPESKSSENPLLK